MHILLIHQAFATINEPGGTRHHEFARLLAEQGHRVSIIASPVSYLTGNKGESPRVTTEMDGKISIYRSYTYSALHKSFFHRLISFISFMLSSFFTALRIRNVDVVWGTSPPIFQSCTAWMVARLKRAKFVLEIRDLWPGFAIAVGVLKNKTIIALSKWLERFLYKHADQVIVNSPGYTQHVKEHGARNVILIPNGADEHFFRSKSKIDNSFTRDWEDQFTILYAGAHGISNDLSIVLSAAKLLEEHQDIRFILLGDGKEKKNLINEAQSMDLNNVQFLDPVPKSDMWQYLKSATLCLAILKPIEMYKTTYPNKVFDYMASEKPIILAIDGVIREVVDAASCGLFCEPGNPDAVANCVLVMRKLGKAELHRMGKNGKEYLKQHFDRKNSVKVFSDMIQQLVSNGK